MSESAPVRLPKFPRAVPRDVANSVLNEIFREAIGASISAAHKQGCKSRDECTEAVADDFLNRLGNGSVMAEIERIAGSLPDRYVVTVPREKTTLKYVTRADYRSFSHTAVLSPALALEIKDSPAPCYIGTDKLGHMVQQGYDYWIIYKNVEARKTGLGELFAHAWGVWSEGKEIDEEQIRSYLKARDLPADDSEVKKIKKEIRHFLTKSDDVLLFSPTPIGVKGSPFLKKLAHVLGTHDKGILGMLSTGIFSYADIEANEAGLRFYLDLERDPEYLAKNFDIKDYATCDWDEEVLRPELSPLIERRIDEAVSGRRKSFFARGLGINYDIPNNVLALSTPLFFFSSGDLELRLRAGGAMPLSSDEDTLYADSQLFSAFDFLFRLSGLHYAYLTTSAGVSAERKFRSTFGAGYEVFLLGKTSLQIGWQLDNIRQDSSANLGVLILW